MALGRRSSERRGEFWIAASESATGPRHVFYEQLNTILAEAGFDEWVEGLCEPYYAEGGRPSIPPGVFFRMMYIGYFEAIDSQRGIAWRCRQGRTECRGVVRWLNVSPQRDAVGTIRPRRTACR